MEKLCELPQCNAPRSTNSAGNCDALVQIEWIPQICRTRQIYGHGRAQVLLPEVMLHDMGGRTKWERKNWKQIYPERILS